MVYIDTEDYPVNDTDVRQRIERFANSNAPEVDTLIKVLEKAGVYVEKGWHGSEDSFIIPTSVNVEEQNDWAFEMYMDSCGEYDNEYDAY